MEQAPESPTVALAIAAWHASDPAPDPADVREALEPTPARVWAARDTTLVSGVDATVIAELLTRYARGRTHVFALVVGDPAALEPVALRAIEQARRTPWGLAARAFPTRARNRDLARGIEALLGLHLAVLRDRTPRDWAVVDAKAQLGTAVAAAARLKVSHQTVSQRLRATHLKATDRTVCALAELLRAHRAPG